MVCDSHKAFQAGQTILKIQDVSFFYGRKQVLDSVSFDITAGRLCGLLGPNGSGKTTLFKCCLGFFKTTAGRILLGDKPLSQYTSKHLAAHVAYVPQEHQPAFPYSVREMVEMGRTPHRGALPVLSKTDHHAVEHALERVGLRALADEPFTHLSGGQRQLVLVARALAQEAALMFLDEPTASLDFSNQLIVWETVRDIAAQGLGVVICCHDPNHILWFCDDVAALKNGHLLATGPAAETLTRKLLETLYDRPIHTAETGSRVFIYP
ncbi:ABC transporter ATP-binding protein [Desulfosarcina sp. OttesenSCG-928-G10]|nr:ABC transporter ATP-binding protein [Desulfosarcina sp. OttesenSCG-928-G10]MDL2321048.1 ABC transporter ATP-binding protein [Desulfosarcina sp. OttesenSCG-928-B08]